MLPFTRVKLVVDRGVRVASDPQQGAESVERIEPPVEAKREFIAVRLSRWMTDAVMSPHQPSLQVREDEVDDR